MSETILDRFHPAALKELFPILYLAQDGLLVEFGLS